VTGWAVRHTNPHLSRSQRPQRTGYYLRKEKSVYDHSHALRFDEDSHAMTPKDLASLRRLLCLRAVYSDSPEVPQAQQFLASEKKTAWLRQLLCLRAAYSDSFEVS